eukprot:1812684-Prymnesium_polylepis.1
MLRPERAAGPGRGDVQTRHERDVTTGTALCGTARAAACRPLRCSLEREIPFRVRFSWSPGAARERDGRRETLVLRTHGPAIARLRRAYGFLLTSVTTCVLSRCRRSRGQLLVYRGTGASPARNTTDEMPSDHGPLPASRPRPARAAARRPGSTRVCPNRPWATEMRDPMPRARLRTRTGPEAQSVTNARCPPGST